MGIHLDTDVIYLQNRDKQNMTRKNGCIINTGNNPTVAERNRKIDENRRRYQLAHEKIESIKLPKRELEQDVNLDAIKDRLRFLKERLLQFEKRLVQVQRDNPIILESNKANPSYIPKIKVSFPPITTSASVSSAQSEVAPAPAAVPTPAIQAGSKSSSALDAPKPKAKAKATGGAAKGRPRGKKAGSDLPPASSSSSSSSKVRLPQRYQKPPPGCGMTEDEWRDIMVALSPDEREQLVASYYGGAYESFYDVDEDDDFEDGRSSKKRKGTSSGASSSSKKRKPASSTSENTKKRNTSHAETTNTNYQNDDFMQVDTPSQHQPSAPAAILINDSQTQLQHQPQEGDGEHVDNDLVGMPSSSPGALMPDMDLLNGSFDLVHHDHVGDGSEPVFDLGY